MKAFELNAFGLESLSVQDMATIDGGIPWRAIWKAAKKGLRWAAELIAAHYVDKALDSLDDECYYGGEFPPAYCYGD